MKVLDLFSGLGGWSRAFADRGHDVVTLDIESRFNPTICADILTVTPLDFKEPFDVVLASPPCECFSVASLGHHWGGGWRAYEPKTPAAYKAMMIAWHTVNLVQMLHPKAWIIENPRGVLRKMPFMAGLDRQTVTYCQYGEGRMKPTDLWGGFPSTLALKPMCKNGDPCHEAAPRGAKTGTQGIKGAAARAVIPYDLSLDVCLAMEQLLAVEVPTLPVLPAVMPEVQL